MPNHPRYQRYQPKRWYPPSMIQRLTANAHNQAWLTDTSSLTQKLRQYCPGLRVEIISEGFDTPLHDEAQNLRLPTQQQAWLRQIRLMCGDQPLVYARSVMPHFTTRNPWWHIKHLGHQPLGEVLFNQPQLKRSDFEFCQAAWPKQGSSSPLLARRCCFYNQNAPLLLTEVFLPQIWCLDSH